MKNRIEELENLIKKHNDLYYNQDSPEISDYEYDKLVKELKQLKPDSSILQDIGQPTWGKKVKHDVIMGSLSKCHSAEEVETLEPAYQKVAMPKIDGLSLSLHYKNGKLFQAVTRGNGIEGEDVTENAKKIKNIPQIIETNINIEIRGECYINQKVFYKEFSSEYANPRNYAAGSLKQKDSNVTATRKLSFVAYRIISTLHPFITTKEQEIFYLKHYGFETVDIFLVKKLDEIESVINKFVEMRTNEKFPYEIDGIVFQVNDLTRYEKLGMKGNNPVGAVAFKFDTEKAETKIKNIEWKTSRTGKIVPVAILEPVQLCGTTVKRVTLNNIDFINKLSIHIGDTILFEKANEIIPKVLSVTRRSASGYLTIPSKCPSCGSKTEIDGAHLICTSKECTSQKIKFYTNFIKALDLKGMSEKTIERIVDSDILENKSLFELTEQDYLDMDFGPTQSKNFVKIFNKEVTEIQFLSSLGIPNASKRTFEELLKVYSFESLIKDAHKFNVFEFSNISGIGELTSQYIVEGLKEKQFFINLNLKHIQFKKQIKSSNKLNNKSFCITGTLSKSRKEFEKLIIENGGQLGSVNKNLDYLIVGNDAGSKLDKAKSLGIKIINENEFLKML